MSYFVVGIVGVLTYHIPPRWRWLYLAAALVVFGVSLAVKRDFTQLGHFSALLLGLACYPLTRIRAARARGCVNSGLWRSATTTSNASRRCVELARVALDDGDEPFGSILVDADGATLFEDRNRVKDGDAHPPSRVRDRPLGRRQPDSRRTGPRDRVHLRRALPDVRGRARLGRPGPHRLRRVVGAADPVARRMGRAAAAGGAAADHHASRPASIVDGPAPELADTMKALYEAKFRP